MKNDSMFRQRLGVSVLLGLGCAFAAQAAPLAIVATPTETTGGFLHNVFHSATSNGGASGTIRAWYNLDTTLGAGESNYWDPVTGDLEIHVNLYSNSSLTTLVGTVVGTSPPGSPYGADSLNAANMSAPDAQDGGLIGDISWNFDAAALSFLQAADPAIADNTVLAFVDRRYAPTTAGGFQPNSIALVGGLTSVTLWGADRASLISTLTTGDNFNVATTTLGTDLVFQVVPVPAPLMLLGSALVALGGLRARQGWQTN